MEKWIYMMNGFNRKIVDITFDDEINLRAMAPSMNKVGIRMIYLQPG